MTIGLEEQNEELQAAVLTRGVEEGRHLLNGTLNSLAQELEEMSQAQVSYSLIDVIFLSSCFFFLGTSSKIFICNSYYLIFRKFTRKARYICFV